ncbi:hypothetical protein [uncultured Desulfobacter sp.]|uniref:hypothetical protein n=1 Tax=uncultured Desulfobacter sp. TaxID=240139 RepID=UPI00259BF187|nr:hypothetical protein [uncultured Desulfobacter sp.]
MFCRPVVSHACLETGFNPHYPIEASNVVSNLIVMISSPVNCSGLIENGQDPDSSLKAGRLSNLSPLGKMQEAYLYPGSGISP